MIYIDYINDNIFILSNFHVYSSSPDVLDILCRYVYDNSGRFQSSSIYFQCSFWVNFVHFWQTIFESLKASSSCRFHLFEKLLLTSFKKSNTPFNSTFFTTLKNIYKKKKLKYSFFENLIFTIIIGIILKICRNVNLIWDQHFEQQIIILKARGW